MTARDPALAAFVDALLDALKAKAVAGSATATAIERAAEILADPAPPTAPTPERDPAYQWLDEAEQNAATSAAANLAAAFQPITPRLAWRARKDRKSSDPNFADAHANAVIVGEGGLEERADIRIGASLLAPNTLYPNHNHPPEEVYVALSAGQWRQNDGPWNEPGPGGLIYNPPNIVHAMQSGEAPLLAIWTLPMASA